MKSSFRIAGSWSIVALTGALALALVLGCSQQPNGTAASRIAPDFELDRVDGGALRLSDYRGKVVLLYFWATWCPPCLESIPFKNELLAKYGEDGLGVLGLSMDRDPEAVRRFLRENPVDYPVAMVDAPTREAFGGVPAVPLTILVDRNGVIRKEEWGYRNEDVARIERKIQYLLTES